MKKILLFLFATIIFVGCGNTDDKANKEPVETAKEQPVEITLAEFQEKAPELVGKEIVFTAIVDHTCKHGGKRLFVVDENSDAFLKVESSKTITSFDAELAGSTVRVTAVVTEKIIDEAYLDEWEEDTKKEIDSKKKLYLSKHEKGEEEIDEVEEGLSKIKDMRDQLAESGKDHLSFYSAEIVSLEVLDQEEK